ncbi:MAG: ZIP family metal transporter [Patescibacteria group bacterium]
MVNLIWALAAAIVVGLISFVGAITLFIKDDWLKKVIIFIVSFSAGSMMGGAFFHLLPEALAKDRSSVNVFIYLLVGFCLFFLLERVLRWRHCHEGECETHSHLGWLNVIGGGVHNMIDGMIIFAAFIGGPTLGIAVTLSIILHEIPQELGDFGVLIYSGFSKSGALVYNFLSAIVAVLGVLLAFYLFKLNNSVEFFLLPFAAGGFLYIAASDLVPELHKDRNVFKAAAAFIIFIAALTFMLFMKMLFE